MQAGSVMEAGSAGAAGATGSFGVFQRAASVAVRVTCGFTRGFRCATSPALCCVIVLKKLKIEPGKTEIARVELDVIRYLRFPNPERA